MPTHIVWYLISWNIYVTIVCMFESVQLYSGTWDLVINRAKTLFPRIQIHSFPFSSFSASWLCVQLVDACPLSYFSELNIKIRGKEEGVWKNLFLIFLSFLFASCCFHTMIVCILNVSLTTHKWSRKYRKCETEYPTHPQKRKQKAEITSFPWFLFNNCFLLTLLASRQIGLLTSLPPNVTLIRLQDKEGRQKYGLASKKKQGRGSQRKRENLVLKAIVLPCSQWNGDTVGVKMIMVMAVVTTWYDAYGAEKYKRS